MSYDGVARQWRLDVWRRFLLLLFGGILCAVVLKNAGVERGRILGLCMLLVLFAGFVGEQLRPGSYQADYKAWIFTSSTFAAAEFLVVAIAVSMASTKTGEGHPADRVHRVARGCSVDRLLFSR